MRLADWRDLAPAVERVRRWREICPDLTLRSTFIVGFPGETDQDFDVLLDTETHAVFAVHAGELKKNRLLYAAGTLTEPKEEPKPRGWLAYTPPPMAIPFNATMTGLFSVQFSVRAAKPPSPYSPVAAASRGSGLPWRSSSRASPSEAMR